VAFYRDVLQMRVVFEAPANPHHGRHAMISPGGTGMGLHFFELASAQIFRFPDAVPSKPDFLPGALNTLRSQLLTKRLRLHYVSGSWRAAYR
jgi:hypothetical protein